MALNHGSHDYHIAWSIAAGAGIEAIHLTMRAAIAAGAFPEAMLHDFTSKAREAGFFAHAVDDMNRAQQLGASMKSLVSMGNALSAEALASVNHGLQAAEIQPPAPSKDTIKI